MVITGEIIQPRTGGFFAIESTDCLVCTERVIRSGICNLIRLFNCCVRPGSIHTTHVGIEHLRGVVCRRLAGDISVCIHRRRVESDEERCTVIAATIFPHALQIHVILAIHVGKHCLPGNHGIRLEQQICSRNRPAFKEVGHTFIIAGANLIPSSAGCQILCNNCLSIRRRIRCRQRCCAKNCGYRIHLRCCRRWEVYAVVNSNHPLHCGKGHILPHRSIAVTGCIFYAVFIYPQPTLRQFPQGCSFQIIHLFRCGYAIFPYKGKSIFTGNCHESGIFCNINRCRAITSVPGCTVGIFSNPVIPFPGSACKAG